jgi:hypothetical protein
MSPKVLTRKAVKQRYTKLSEATWDWLFDIERQNSRLHACRAHVQDAGRTIYYDRAKLEVWLVEEGHYREHDFGATAALDTILRMPFRQHLMIG